jgi:hypothetical protein
VISNRAPEAGQFGLTLVRTVADLCSLHTPERMGTRAARTYHAHTHTHTHLHMLVAHTGPDTPRCCACMGSGGYNQQQSMETSSIDLACLPALHRGAHAHAPG